MGGEEERSRVKKGKGARRVQPFSVSRVFYGCKRVVVVVVGLLLTGAVPSGNLLGLPV